jgi:Na+/H+-translocating membrane pyrophosphatase
VGGGIYTKAADVGADLVGKVEAGIPEDDPRNPATIADNVGDNVGDVAGMGADLYESYCGSILATSALGAAAFITTGDVEMQYKAVIAPMLIATIGIFLSIIGIFSVKTKENAKMKDFSDIFICPVVKEEVIAGSTRMKSGTAQKMILNMLSTGGMVRTGRVRGNYMAYMVPSNKKLVDRAIRIICDETGCEQGTAREFLEKHKFMIADAIDDINSNK